MGRDGRDGRPYGNQFLQRLAFDIFHGDEDLAFVLADLVDGDDVGMVQCGRGLGFALEALSLASGSAVICRGRNFNATWRLSLVSSAR